MKKISAVLFSFLLVLGLAACGEVRESASPAAGSAENGMETANAETVSPEAAGTETGNTETEESGMQQSAGQQNTILIAYAPGEDGDMVERAAGLLAQEPGGDLFPLEEETDSPSEMEAGADRTGETGTQAETNTPDGPYEFIFLGFSAGGILSGEMLLNFDGQVNGTALDADYVPDSLDEISPDAAACGMIYSFYGRLSVGTTDVELLRSGSLPPTFYCYGTRDPFYNQFLANADAAEEAGVSVERLQLDGMPHGFGARGGWIPAYDEWLSGIFENN